jgi:membrane protease YdiL (CAAX protease family)
LKQPTYGDAAGAIALAVLFVLVAMTGVALTKAGSLLLVAAIQGSFLAAAVLWAQMRRLDPVAMRVQSPRPIGMLLCVAGMAALTAALAQCLPLQRVLFEQLGWDFTPEIRQLEDQMKRMSDQSRILMVLAATLLPAICEEALFRMVALSGFVKSFGPVRGLLYTSVLFAAIHPVLPQVMMVFFVALAIGAAVLITRSVWTGAAMHFTNNALALTLPEPERTNPWVLLACLAVAAGAFAAASRACRSPATPAKAAAP